MSRKPSKKKKEKQAKKEQEEKAKRDSNPFLKNVFDNILKGPLIELAPDMAAHAAPGGHIILSGLLVVQAEALTAAYQAAGFRPEAREDIGEWSTLVLIRN